MMSRSLAIPIAFAGLLVAAPASAEILIFQTGRVMAICELLDLTDHVREIILDRRPISEVKRAAKEQGMRFLRESAVERVMHGLTTVREINKVTFVE